MAIDFEQITDTFEDGFDNAKKFVKKNKVFTFALIGVGAIALFRAYQNKNTSATSETAYVPTYYDGYPIVDDSYYGSGMSSNSDYLSGYEDATTIYDDNIESIVEQIEAENEHQISNIINTYETKLFSLTETMSAIEEKNKVESVKNQMANNSNLYGLTGDMEERKKLHQANVELGNSIGATFDDNTGTWWLNGERLYYTNNELSGDVAPITSLNQNVGKNNNPVNTVDITNVGYDKNTDYMGKIIDTLNNGGSVADVNLYDSQRDNKIKGENISKVSYDPNTDYQALINKATSMGADQSVIDSLNEIRNAKIEGEKKKNTSSTSSKSSSSSKSSNSSTWKVGSLTLKRDSNGVVRIA